MKIYEKQNWLGEIPSTLFYSNTFKTGTNTELNTLTGRWLFEFWN